MNLIIVLTLSSVQSFENNKVFSGVNSLETFVVVRPLFSDTFTQTCHKSSLIVFDGNYFRAKSCLRLNDRLFWIVFGV